MNRRVIFLAGLIAASIGVLGQQPKNRAPTVNEIRKDFMTQLKASRPDTNQIKLLLSISDFYWRRTVQHDSSALFAEQARKLSRSLRYEHGMNEGSFYLCRALVEQNRIADARMLLPGLAEEQQARLLIRIGEDFLFRPALHRNDLDSAHACFRRALAISEAVSSRLWKHESLIALGKYYFAAGEFSKGKDCFLSIIGDHHQAGDSSAEAHIWSELGRFMPDTDSTMDEGLLAHHKAKAMYHRLGDVNNERSQIEDIASIHFSHEQFAIAQALYIQAVEMRKAVDNKTVYKDYIMLATISYALGDLDKALSYTLMTERNMDSLSARYADDGIGIMFGLIYSDEGQTEKGLQYFLKEIVHSDDPWCYFICRKIVELYIALGKPQQALTFLQEFERKRPPERPSDKEAFQAVRADCYLALNNPALAEKYYLEMIHLDAEAQKSKAREVLLTSFTISGPEAYYKIASFYNGRGDNKRASLYLMKALNQKSFSGRHYYTSNLMRKIWLLKFKTDSTSGNYTEAIRSYQRYTALNDSIFNVAKIRQLQHLQVQYETQKKEEDIQRRDQQIQVLTQNDRLRQANLEQANQIRNITMAVIGILIVAAAVFYRQYLQKQRSSTIIAEKNSQLEHLLTEKEWLLKEVHHRVKNNLHTIICLLESQAVYLKDDALQAVENSQHRVYAMSLIHQKLYQADNVKTIQVADYLPEFIQYLKESFGSSRDIVFEVRVDPIELDVSKAIPVALIVNEAVTNSIKYAFPKRRGSIRVEMKREGDHVRLVIADDGIGMPEHLKETKSNSLGIELMKGLSEDIGGRIEFKSDQGTKIMILFNIGSVLEGSGTALVTTSPSRPKQTTEEVIL